jgi:hypothetical protein
MVSAALNARATWDHGNAALWHRCTDLLATASHALQQRRDLPPEFRPLFERMMAQLRSDPADDFNNGNLREIRSREERMKVNSVEAVLSAADEWVSAQEALVASKQISHETEAEEEALDLAGSRLVVAVTRWRLKNTSG